MRKINPFLYIKNRTKGVVFGRTRLGEIANSIYDNYIFLKYSFSVNHLRTKQNYESYLTKQYHIIEKGLSLPNPRKNFGKPKIIELINKSEEYINQFGDDKLIGTIRQCLTEYKIKNNELKDIDFNFYTKLNNFITIGSFKSNGGTKEINKNYIKEITNINYEEFVKTRVSVRDFDDLKVDIKDVIEAVEIARHAPSVCNRQGWKLHFYNDRETMNTLLQYQGGNGGFTESIKALFIITTDTESFTNLEKNQVFVDGGLFSMNLLLALHSKGIGACCLNTCFPFTTELKVKKTGKIKSSERLIMMVGIGYLKDEFKCAYSIKKEVDEILVQH